MPGTLCTALAFRHQLTALRDVCRPQALPLAHGATVAETAAWVLEQAPERFALAGFSQGAIVAFELLRQAPERITRLALLAANPKPPTPQQLETWQRWREQARTEGLAAIVPAFLGGLHPAHAAGPWLRAAIEQMAFDTGVETFCEQLAALASRSDSRPTLPALAAREIPTLLLVGRQDPITPLELHQELAAALPRATLLPIDECGHYAPMEQPQAVSAALRYWLQLPAADARDA